MKIALITTTINVPTVLSLYRPIDPDVRFFVAMDTKSPPAAYEFCHAMDNCEVLQPTVAKYECDALIGKNTDSRRNIALLAALEWGAEWIVSTDDDMGSYPGLFLDFEWLFVDGFRGVQFGSPNCWVDAGLFSVPPAGQRGLPPEPTVHLSKAEFVDGVKIGAAQGIILGVPDTDAVTALGCRPFVHSASDVLKNGFVVHPQAYAVFNSQLTAFRKEFAPAFAQFYAHQGRNTDLFASMLMRRVMAERNYYTHYGMPMGYHARAPRPLFKDLKAELYGMEHIAAFARYLSDTEIKGNNVIEDCEYLMLKCPIFSDDLKKVAAAWYRDCEKVL